MRMTAQIAIHMMISLSNFIPNHFPVMEDHAVSGICDTSPGAGPGPSLRGRTAGISKVSNLSKPARGKNRGTEKPPPHSENTLAQTGNTMATTEKQSADRAG